jgi:hypothetical protein
MCLLTHSNLTSSFVSGVYVVLWYPLLHSFIIYFSSFGVLSFMGAIQFLPACRMFLAMCPEGAEGASYAMLTTVSIGIKHASMGTYAHT